MTEMKDYRILITETRQKTVTVRATSEKVARRRAEDAWKNAECVLDAENFQGVEFHVLGGSEGGDDKYVERIEEKNV